MEKVSERGPTRQISLPERQAPHDVKKDAQLCKAPRVHRRLAEAAFLSGSVLFLLCLVPYYRKWTSSLVSLFKFLLQGFGPKSGRWLWVVDLGL